MPPAVDIPLALISLFGALHVLGEHRATRLTGRPRSRLDRTRSAYFYAGLVVILIALASPIDSLSDKLFWVHMIQHVLILGVAAPLIVLGAPWNSIWRPLPLGFRRSDARTIGRSGWAAPLRALGRLLSAPIPAWIAYNVNLAVWHIPAAYDAAVGNRAIHDLEHTTFLLFGVLLWAQVIDSPPLRARLNQFGRIVYVVAASIPGWLIALVLVFATSPLYPIYAHLRHRPGGISALVDQQLAGGMMLVPGSLAMTIYVFVQIYRWLDADEKKKRPPRGGQRLTPPSPDSQGDGPGPNGNGAHGADPAPSRPTVEVV
jgi:cytochrome c oxidase assembly factor CtaG